MKRYLVEALGTFFLTFTVALTSNPLSIGMVFAAMIYLGGHISGAHYNPAVSLALFFRQKISSKHLGFYMLFQTLGALVAAELFYLITQSTLSFPVSSDLLVGVVQEVLPTFILAAVALEVLTCNRFKVTELSGLILGFTLTGISFFLGVFNPAILLSAILSSLLHSMDLVNLGAHLVYMLYPFAGAVLAAFTFNYLNGESHSYKESHQ